MPETLSRSSLSFLVLSVLLIGFSPATTMAAESIEINMKLLGADGQNRDIGSIRAETTPYGTVFTPNLNSLEPGLHGFHIHANPNCAAAVKDGKSVPGLAAGGHYDPLNSGRHEGPYGGGHLGDLPPLYVDAGGAASQPVLAPRVSLEDLSGHALMIHASGDNYSDQPAKLGGGGARKACGVVR